MFAVRACRACFESRGKMYDLRESPLRDYYEAVTGLKLEDEGVLPNHLCVLCSALARKCDRFRSQCVAAQRVLDETWVSQGQVTEEDITNIDRSRLLPVHLLQTTSTMVLNNRTSDFEDIKSEELEVDARFDDYENDFFDSKVEDLSMDTDDEDKPLSHRKNSRKGDVKIELELKSETLFVEDINQELKKSPKKPAKKKKTEKKKEIKKKVIKKPPQKKKAKETDDEPKKKRISEISVKDVQKFATLTILTHEEQVEEMEKRKNTANYKNSPFKCDMCYKGFVDTGTYKNHMRRHGSDCGEFECGVCHVRRSTAHRLRGHITAVHSRKYTCNTCARVSTNANQALEHEKWHRGVRHPCQFCDKSFSKWSSRLSHERLRHRSQFVCSTCGDAFVSRLGLAQHRSRAHKQTSEEERSESPRQRTRDGAYCAECDVHFSTQQAYTRHTLTSDKHGHDATMTTGCRRCGVVFTSEEAWTEHARSHAVRCGRVRKRLYVLPRLGRVICQECGEEFKAASHCIAHYKADHPGVKYPAEFVCETCGRKCKNRAVLLYHQRTHTGERPYPCDICGAAFKHQSNLRRHSRVHTGEKLFQCELCYKRFTQKVGKEMHIKTVHEKQPYPKRNRGAQRDDAPGARPPHDARADFLQAYRSYKLTRQSKSLFRTHAPPIAALKLTYCKRGSDNTVQTSEEERSESPRQRTRDGAYCAECDVHFSTQQAYTRHTLTSDKHGHDATMTTGCRRCGVVFTSEEAWTEHARSHAVRCGRVRKRLYVLPRLGRVICQECGEEFKAASHCIAHYKADHPGVKYPAEFVCETCGRKCKNRAVLLYHQRTHTGERPYPCDICGAAFKHQSNLRRHSRVHTGEKLFQCELCYKRFTQKVGKEMHIKTVHEKQPYPKRNRGAQRDDAPGARPPHDARADFLQAYRSYKLT